MPKKSKKTKNSNKLPKSSVMVEKQIRQPTNTPYLPPHRQVPLYYSQFGANTWA
tara:strand:+ start:3228 stop:3389 length:162 start_codon:yes stop_codon:yes gene_type:complete